MPRLRGVALALLPAFVLSVALAASIFAPGAVPAARAHDTSTLQGHIQEDIVPPHDRATERRLERHTSGGHRAADAAAAAATVTGNAGQVGQWGPVVDWPVVGVHVALLENGKVLAYDSVGDNATETYPVHDHTRATVWDPATGTQTPVNVSRASTSFAAAWPTSSTGPCSSPAGTRTPSSTASSRRTSSTPDTNTWSLGPNMAAGRWYPSVTPLSNGEIADHLGRPGHAGGAQDRRQPARAQHGLARPAAVPVDRRRARRPRLLLGSRPDDAQPRHSRRRLVAELRPARLPEPRLRQPCALRRRQDPRRGRRRPRARTPASST